MNTGDIVTDSQANAWTLQSRLGAGVWGETWVVEDRDGTPAALKLPRSADGPVGNAADEQADILATATDEISPLLPRLLDRITLPSGQTALLLQLYPTTVERQLRSALPLVEALDVLTEATRAASALGTHGNLRPSNILVRPDGVPVLSDRSTPAAGSLIQRERTEGPRRPWAPEDRVAVDTWAICQALYTAVMLDDGAPVGDGTLPTCPAGGLDKVALAAVKDRAEARLKRDGANRRFVRRTADRIGALLSRGLSAQSDPSPPYRFLQTADLLPRLEEIRRLVHPGIESVGRLLLSNNATGRSFVAPAAVEFTVSVAPTDGVDDAEHIVAGLKVTDQDTGERVPLEDARFEVDKQASGRLRYSFALLELKPGRYHAGVAFSIKESGARPVVAEGEFEVRPPPGYVPPAREDAPVALAFQPGMKPPEPSDEDDEDDAATELMTGLKFDFNEREQDTSPDDDDASAGGEVIEAFPRPLAPSSPGTLVDRQPESPAPAHPRVSAPLAPSAAPTRPTPPPLMAVPTPPPSEPGSEVTGSAPGTPTHSTVPPSVVPSIAPPGLLPTNPGTDVGPVPAANVAVPRPEALDQTPETWKASTEVDAEFFSHAEMDAYGTAPVLPGSDAFPSLEEGDDLLGDREPSPLDAILDRIRDIAAGDIRILLGAVTAVCFLMVVLLLILLKACN